MASKLRLFEGLELICSLAFHLVHTTTAWLSANDCQSTNAPQLPMSNVTLADKLDNTLDRREGECTSV